MIREIHFSKPVSRIILASEFYAKEVSADSLFGQFKKRFEAALENSWKVNVSVGSTETVLALVDIVSVVLHEPGRKKAETEILNKFLREIDHVRSAIALAEEQQAKKDAERSARQATEARKSQTRTRQRTMSSIIEWGRWTQLNHIAEDYGISLADPQVKAALIAAFHAGALAYSNGIGGIAYHDPALADEADMKNMAEHDALIFEKAQVAKEGNQP